MSRSRSANHAADRGGTTFLAQFNSTRCDLLAVDHKSDPAEAADRELVPGRPLAAALAENDDLAKRFGAVAEVPFEERLAHLVDLDRTYVSGIERGERNPRPRCDLRLFTQEVM
jgi:hypothetical protein